ncbi:transcription-repair coupling factor [Candidatus Xianfuyuplasma coldseepsis]|uniref:Transcription-repair-coupling factor n=1 Tax=Candidatus Xianfuyuplasma coldseepsis TaxID=2782163 RepID=A0A7L7KRA0_9MOLU|nr:transcription-repair coupling factor [Xianfuyuplasma coldseepsis]QMS84939.1 transcription-repair coupling factor [Xianfuyuplasma coldseepsis]
MKKILEYIHNKPFYTDITNTFSNNKDVHIVNTNDSMSILSVLHIFAKQEGSIVLVTPNIYNAQKVYDLLANHMDENNLAFFPQDEFMTTEMLAMSSEFKVERIHTVVRILQNQKLIIVTNTTGLIKKLMPLKRWEKALIRLKKNSIVNVQATLQKLIFMGYQREETVEQQGEFSYRGGILDVYPLNEENPVRVEFFDDEVDSIRFFDINTQRSTIKATTVDIFPMYEFYYDQEDYLQIKQQVEEKLQQSTFKEKSLNRILDDLQALEHHNDIDKLARYQTFLPYKEETILDYIDNNIVVYWEHKRVLDNYDDVVHDITDWYEATEDYPKLGFELIQDIHHIFAGKSLYLDVFGDVKQSDKTINVRAKEAILYNNNIHMLLSDLGKYKGFTTIIITFKTEKGMRHFINLVDDKIPYNIIGRNDHIINKQLNIMVSDNQLSFEHHDINTIVLTEDNLFKQKEHKHGKYRSSMKDAKKISTVEELKKGDLIVHHAHGIGRFLGVIQMTVGDYTNDYIHIAYKGDDTLYIPVENIHLIQKYIGSEGIKPKIHKLGSGEWARTKLRVRKKVKDIADKLIKLYAAREQAEGFAFSPDSEFQMEFESDFEYQETPDQITAIDDVKQDMESTMPMDRLLCGDVGYGKTEVAMRAAFKAVLDNKQVAYLAPTTVLSRQHYYTFKERFDKYGIKVGLLNRFVTKAVQRDILNKAMTGEMDVIIGTHRILSKDMKFHDLGLLIVDEEQRFGVEHKERIKELKINIDVLSLSATPIPRTLQMAIMGVKNMSLLETPPLNRYPIQTYVLERNNSIIRDAIQREMARNGQVFYLYNRVDDIGVVANQIERLVPEARVCYAHGKMSRLRMENVIQAFLDGEYDVLVSTTIIETGIDIPNANTLLIHDSDRLGLSQLYQIRGRVGRSNRIAYAYLMYTKNKELTEEAMKRLRVIKEFTELGSGFKIAVRDLSIRGAGDVLGTEQSGFMDSVGLDLFLEMLKEEVDAKQQGIETTIEEPVDEITTLKLRVDKYIDSNYIQNDYIKMEMHRKIARIESKEDIKQLQEEFQDRFGMPPKEIDLYMYEKLFEHLAKIKGLEKIRELKNNITFRLTKEASRNINGEYVFEKAYTISKFIRFQYKNEQLNIILDTIKLNRHYVYVIVDLLEIL